MPSQHADQSRLLVRFRAIDGADRRHDYEPGNDRDADLIQRNRLHFSPASSFNDPFEARPAISWSRDGRPTRSELERIVRERMPTLSDAAVAAEVARGVREFDDEARRAQYRIDSVAQHRKVFAENPMACFSAEVALGEPLLWAHYADSHRGYAACFDFDVPWHEEITLSGSKRRVRLTPMQVHYSADYPVIDGDADFRDPTLFDEVTRAALRTKAEQWRYEKEHRIVLVGQQPGPREFPAAMLKAIVLGARIEPESEAKLIELASSSASRPQILRCALHDSRFELLIRYARPRSRAGLATGEWERAAIS